MTDQKRSHIFESANHLIYETLSFPRELCVKLGESHLSFSWWGVDHSISWCWAQQEGQLREFLSHSWGFDFLSWSFIAAEIWQYFLGKNGNHLPLSIHRCACYHGSWTPNRAQCLNIISLCHSTGRELGLYLTDSLAGCSLPLSRQQ